MPPASKKKSPAKVLIVEDEVLIADTISMKLERNGYQITDVAISYEEAIMAFQKTRPDVVLLDIQLSGPRSGVDVAWYLRRQNEPPPFIFLTSQMDAHHLNEAKQTFPAAYLAKPIQINTLLASLQLAVFNTKSFSEKVKTIEVRSSGVNHVLPINHIHYFQSEHVYLRFHLTDDRQMVVRSTLQEMLELIDSSRFVQVHRSYVVNLNRVTGHDTTSIYFGQEQVPVSRSRRKAVFKKLKSGA